MENDNQQIPTPEAPKTEEKKSTHNPEILDALFAKMAKTGRVVRVVLN